MTKVSAAKKAKLMDMPMNELARLMTKNKDAGNCMRCGINGHMLKDCTKVTGLPKLTYEAKAIQHAHIFVTQVLTIYHSVLSSQQPLTALFAVGTLDTRSRIITYTPLAVIMDTGSVITLANKSLLCTSEELGIYDELPTEAIHQHPRKKKGFSKTRKTIFKNRLNSGYGPDIHTSGP